VLAVVCSRTTERTLLVLVGGFAIYLGYRLFLSIPGADRELELIRARRRRAADLARP